MLQKFLDSSKLKRHFLIHTGERDFVCPHEGCGKMIESFKGHSCFKLSMNAFSLDFNLRSHMKTHSQENYHICPYSECGKRYAHEYKLKNHIASHHEKGTFCMQENVEMRKPMILEDESCLTLQNSTPDVVKYATPPERILKNTRPPPVVYGSASSDRPYICPYEGCEKDYIHEYKLKLHLRREHPDHMADENAETANTNADNEMDEASDQDAYGGKRVNGKIKDDTFEEEDSEETEEEDHENAEDGWRYGRNDDDDEETEDED
ncbi:hypothetical protein OIU76_004858 [Salix suchowensis]|nr:hypothetical protein OIU76_004858 [Salix suchowensis]